MVSVIDGLENVDLGFRRKVDGVALLLRTSDVRGGYREREWRSALDGRSHRPLLLRPTTRAPPLPSLD